MKLQLFAFLAMVALAIAQGVTDKIAPDGDAPAGCEANTDSKFEITIVPLKTKAKKDLAIETRYTCPSGDGTLVLTLSDSVLTDAHNRTGYIASNYQFQFDNPPQAGAIYTAGFSACTNGSLALGGSAVFWQCASGTFYNLYDRYWAEQCEPALIVALPCGGNGEDAGGAQSGGVSEMTVGTEVVTTTMVVPLSDGQPQVVTTTSVVYICQIGDGQVQAHQTPCTAVPTGVPASQISDGQVQVTPGPATTAASLPPASQLSDGQVVASSVSLPGDTTSGPAQVPTEAPPVSSAAGGGQGGGASGLVAAVVMWLVVVGVGGGALWF